MWNEDCQQTFTALEQILVHVPVLPYLDPELPYILIFLTLTQARKMRESSCLSYVMERSMWWCITAQNSANLREIIVTHKELAVVMKGNAHFYHCMAHASRSVLTMPLYDG